MMKEKMVMIWGLAALTMILLVRKRCRHKIGNILRSSKAAPAPASASALLKRLIASQSFDGSWTGITDLFCTEMKISGDATRSAVVKLVDASKRRLDRTKAEHVLSTAIVITFLEKKMEDKEETWELVVEKARTWLDDAVADDVLAEVWKLAESIVEV